MYDTILVPVDGSDCSLRAAREASGIADAYDADVHLLSVVDVRTYGVSSPEGGAGTPAIQDALVERAEAALAEAADLFSDDVATSEVRRGVPGPDITEYAAEAGVDLIVMGTHGLTGIDRVVLGSVAERVLRRAPAPVLTVRERVPEADGYDRVLVPTDGSPHAEAAADHAIDVATRYEADLHVVSVLDLQAEGGIFDAGGLSEEFVERHERALGEATERIATRGEEAGLDVETAVVRGAPHDAILEYASGNEVDLIGMGTHGRSGVSRVLLGSVTESVVRKADCPVLSVRATSE